MKRDGTHSSNKYHLSRKRRVLFYQREGRVREAGTENEDVSLTTSLIWREKGKRRQGHLLRQIEEGMGGELKGSGEGLEPRS